MSYHENLKRLSDWVTVDRSVMSGGYSGFTTVYVTGQTKDVKAYCDEYVKMWHPCGYGTSVREVDSRKANCVTFRVWHSNSCD